MTFTPCGAKTRAGTPCQKPPLKNATRCRLHGGATPQSQAAAKKRELQQRAQAAVTTFGLPRDITAETALIEEVQRSAGMVDYYSTAAAQAAQRGQLVDEYGRPAPPLALWNAERAHLAKVSEAATRAGLSNATAELLAAEAQRASAIAAANDLIRHAKQFLDSATNAIIEALQLPNEQRHVLQYTLETQFAAMIRRIQDEHQEATERPTTP